jgi:Fic family protein
MDFIALSNLKDNYNALKERNGEKWQKTIEDSFDILFTHNSTAIEGNTLSLIETKLVLEDGLSVGGKPLREIFEVTNHKKAFDYVKRAVKENLPISEKAVKDIHALLTENIFIGGVYRNVSVRITGASHRPPAPGDMFLQIKNFYDGLSEKADEYNAIELAAYTHAEFVKIHPFEDGNGRTSRLIMNWQLMSNGFLPVSIAKEDRLAYFNTLEAYAVNSDLSPFSELVAKLEEERLKDYIND